MRKLRLKTGLSVVAVVAALATAAPAAAQNLGISRNRQAIRGALESLRQARTSERAARELQTDLGRRIERLKRDQRKGRNVNSSELQRLLRQSIAAGETLEEQVKARRVRQQKLTKLVRSAAKKISIEMKKQSPKLNSKDPKTRVTAAKNVRELQKLRRELFDLLERTQRRRQARKWAKSLVEIDPLDGPDELGGKADVVALTRSRIAEKRKMIAQLLDGARQQRRVDDALDNFRTDRSLFDEEVRGGGRVFRRPGGGNGQLATQGFNDRGAEAESPAAAPPSEDPGQGVAPPPQDDASPISPDNNTANVGFQAGRETADDVDLTAGPPSADKSVSVAPRSAAGAAPSRNAFGPQALLNLSQQQLLKSGADVETLSALLKDLEQLDKLMARQASKIQRRATELERQERSR